MQALVSSQDVLLGDAVHVACSSTCMSHGGKQQQWEGQSALETTEKATGGLHGMTLNSALAQCAVMCQSSASFISSRAAAATLD